MEESDVCRKLIKLINKNSIRQINIMEVCGTHTRNIFKYCIDKLIDKKINLIAGPGCPVCVTPTSYIDSAIELSRKSGVIIVTFGDMIRVPGSLGSLSMEKAMGGDVHVIFSPLDSLKIAEQNKDKEVVLLGVGFETTAPSIALTVKYAKERELSNFSVLLSLRIMINVMKKLMTYDDVRIDGFICPGHVAAVIGASSFEKLSLISHTPMSICGFKMREILSGILSIEDMINKGEYRCENLYKSVVCDRGSIGAEKIMNQVFTRCSNEWRGMGWIDDTGLKFKEEYKEFDAAHKFNIAVNDKSAVSGCICGEILRGAKRPDECKLFTKVCNPRHPIGPCMVSEEGTCRSFYYI